MIEKGDIFLSQDLDIFICFFIYFKLLYFNQKHYFLISGCPALEDFRRQHFGCEQLSKEEVIFMLNGYLT